MHCWWECKTVQLLWNTGQRFLTKLDIRWLYDPAISPKGIENRDPCPIRWLWEGLKTQSPQRLRNQLLIIAFVISAAATVGNKKPGLRLQWRTLPVGRRRQLLVVCLQGLSGVGEALSLPYNQRLLCRNPPLFEIYQVLLSPTQHQVALIRIKGLTVLELPKWWGMSSEFEGGKWTGNCSNTPTAETVHQFYLSDSKACCLVLKWHAGSPQRAVSIRQCNESLLSTWAQTPPNVITLSEAEEEGLILK